MNYRIMYEYDNGPYRVIHLEVTGARDQRQASAKAAYEARRHFGCKAVRFSSGGRCEPNAPTAYTFVYAKGK